MSAPVIYATVAAVSAANQYQQGATQNALYQLRAEQASIEGERKKLQYEDQANRINESLLEVNSAVAARAASGGVRPFSGSSAMVSAMNNTKAGREWLNSVNAGKMALSAGEAEAGVLRASGRAAQQAGTIGALTTVAMAGGTIYAAGTTPLAGSEAAKAGMTSVPFASSNITWRGLFSPFLPTVR